jgi:hypothetical protein
MWKLIRNYARNDSKLWMGLMVLLSAHHFLIYARQVADELEREYGALENAQAAPAFRQTFAQ